MKSIKLFEINEINREDVLKISVYETQKDFVMPVEKALDIADKSKNSVYPFAIYAEEIVGFAMVRHNPEYNNFFIWQLIIDRNNQNKGYGKASIKKIIEWIKSKNISEEVTTTVSYDNLVSEKLFKQIGFEEMDRDCEEEIDLIYRL